MHTDKILANNTEAFCDKILRILSFVGGQVGDNISIASSRPMTRLI